MIIIICLSWLLWNWPLWFFTRISVDNNSDSSNNLPDMVVMVVYILPWKHNSIFIFYFEFCLFNCFILMIELDWFNLCRWSNHINQNLDQVLVKLVKCSPWKMPNWGGLMTSMVISIRSATSEGRNQSLRTHLTFLPLHKLTRQFWT